ncbi:tetratricopeptide repeat protein, partial [Acidithiobacillus ferrooxidans]|nr:tetratricopeptide repeat protein [Acidithiobacillus ferrooxidans]
MKTKFFGAIAMLWLLAAPAAWAEPSVAQVAQAVQAGHLSQAQGMMREVLAAHPQSAEAQYVEARILARQGDWAGAGAALAKAEQLAPTMPFVKPQVLTTFKQSLQRHVDKPVGKGGHWGAVLAFFLGLVALIALISMLRRRRQQPGMLYRGQPSGPFGGTNGYGPNGPMYPGGGTMGG